MSFTDAQRSTIPRRPDGQDAELSFAQERLWFMEQFAPGTAAFNLPFAVRLRGKLDEAALEHAVRTVVTRHEALRMRFPVTGDGRAALTVDEQARVEWSVIEAAEHRLNEVVDRHAEAPFDLVAGPLVRGVLVRASAEDHVLLVVSHHIVCDGWSVDLFLGEMLDLYAAAASGEPCPLADVPVRYSDFAVWQRERLSGSRSERDLKFWRERLAGVAPLDLPTDRPYPPQQTYRGAAYEFPVGRELTDAIHRLARAHRVTPFVVLLAAFQTLLWRYSGQSDFAVGVPTGGRTRAELEPVIGMFVNMLALRVDVSDDPTFAELLARTRSRLLDAMDHQEIPFERLVAELGVEREMHRSPLFQTLCSMQSYRRPFRELPGLVATGFALRLTATRYELEMHFTEDADGLSGYLSYSTDLFDAGWAVGFAECLLELLSGVVSGSDSGSGVRLSALGVVPAGMLERLAAFGDGGAVEVSGSLVDWFWERVRQAPDAVAVVDRDGAAVSLGELGARVGLVASRLVGMGVGRGSLVGVCAPRGVDLLAGMVGVLSAGAGYVPLDAAVPVERLGFFVADAGVSLILAHSGVADRVSGLDVPVLVVDDPAEWEPGPGAGQFVPAAVSAGDVAYVIYTSGSTGVPKGVVVEHGSLANLLWCVGDRLGCSGGGQVWLGVTSPGFDISALELFLPLVFGGRLVVADESQARDGAALLGLIRSHGVTHVQAVPATWWLLLEAGFDEPSVTALTGAEAVPLELVRRLDGRLAGLFNMYGPTETTVWSAMMPVPAGTDRVRLGGVLGNTRIWVLDPWLRPVPVGVPGELCIGGTGVARGYAGRPGLTAASFVPDPFEAPGEGASGEGASGEGAPGARLYRTGDRARWRADGSLEFLGRADGQVKIRGHRIELGEIETVLAGLAEVAQAAVAVHREVLVGYVVPAVDTQVDGPALRQQCTRVLPAYMIPSQIVAVEALPRNANGKVDRKALPAPGTAHTDPATYAAPATAGEQLIAGIWADILNRPTIGLHDDFFALGGHSLLATRVTARLTAALGVDVPLPLLFANPKLGVFAAAVDGLAGTAKTAAPIPRRPDEHEHPLTSAQMRLWFLNRLDPTDAAYNVYIVRRLTGSLDSDALAAALADVAARHESLRTRYPERDGEPVALIQDPGPVPLELHDLSGLEPEAAKAQARRLSAANTNAPFDVTAAAPLRPMLIRLSPDDHLLNVALHHIAIDGWSIDLFLADLGTCYTARSHGAEPSLPELPIRFGDFAHWKRTTEQDLPTDYWLRKLANPAVLDICTDRPRIPGAPRRGDQVAFELPGSVVEGLERVGRAHRATLFLVLLAAYQVLLSRHTRAEDVLVGTPVAGRDRVQLEQLVGYLTNTIVLRGDLSGDPTFGELLDRTRITAIEAFAHQEVPFERLMAHMSVQRDLGQAPLFQTILVVQPVDVAQPDAAGFAGISVSHFPIDYAQAKFDVLVDAWRDGPSMVMVLGYDAELFEAATMRAWAARFELLLTEIAADAERPISALPLLTPQDWARLRDLAAPPAEASTSGEVVVPQGVAIECGDVALTYAQLRERAARLAKRLRANGIARGSVVGVCLDRSPEAIVAMLAIWRAGGAYLPLDPEYPAARLAQMLTDSGATVVVTRPDLAAPLPEWAVTVLTGDSDEDGAGDGENANPDGDVAYVIYTSGSTGVPKGVEVTHGSVRARVAWMRREYGLGLGDRVVQFASLSFDAHVEEIFPALTSGATLVLLPHGATSLPEHLASEAGRRVTVLDLPTAYWHQLMQMRDEVAWPDGLRLVILGGEQVRADAVELWHERFGDRVPLMNTYGPTEATVIATAGRLEPGDHHPSIGRPVDATTVYILDNRLTPVPPGAPGELCIGGAGVAQGYLRRPALTASAFVPDPFGPPGARLYRTGDRARFRADGRLEFLGRLDDQLKLRGYRIEPGEVESVLLAHPLIRQAAVTAHRDVLVAYVVGEAPQEELARFASASLAPHMVPAYWVRVDALALTPNGKLDRAALPPPQPERVEFVAPRTDAEELVASVWAEVLDVQRVGAHDDFFALGGHSLLATRVVSRLRAIVEVEVPIRRLFTDRTLAGFALAVEETLRAELALLGEEEAQAMLDTEATQDAHAVLGEEAAQATLDTEATQDAHAALEARER
ncbi:MAG TPA: amino acid adenylation domain-containing protein [Candidatus Limnocylindrales bacterium]